MRSKADKLLAKRYGTVSEHNDVSDEAVRCLDEAGN